MPPRYRPPPLPDPAERQARLTRNRMPGARQGGSEQVTPVTPPHYYERVPSAAGVVIYDDEYHIVGTIAGTHGTEIVLAIDIDEDGTFTPVMVVTPLMFEWEVVADAGDYAFMILEAGAGASQSQFYVELEDVSPAAASYMLLDSADFEVHAGHDGLEGVIEIYDNGNGMELDLSAQSSNGSADVFMYGDGPLGSISDQFGAFEVDGNTVLMFGESGIGDPAAPAANRVYLFCKDNGAGKTGIYARFPTGAIQQVALEP